MKRLARSIVVRITIAVAIMASIVWISAASSQPQPSVGIYYFGNTNPTVPPGMQAPLWQIGIRTDSPSIFYKSGTAATAWTEIGRGVGGGGGTVTSIACLPNTGLACTPNPITSTGNVAGVPFGTATNGYAPASGGGTANFLRADGTWATPPGTGVTGTGTSPDLTAWASSTSIGNYAGSSPSACAAGQADTRPQLSASGALTSTCAAFVNAVGSATGLSLTGSTVSGVPFGAATNGYTPASGGGSTNFLRADGTWATPPGTGVTGTGTSPDIAIWSSSTAVGNYTGSTPAACTAGQAVTQPAFSAAGALTTSCQAFVNAVGAGTGLSLTGSTVSGVQFGTATNGYAPSSGGGSTNFLRADGTWAAPPGTGGSVSGTTNTIGKFTSSTTVGNSSVTDDGTAVATTEPFTAGGVTNTGQNVLSCAITPTAFTGVQVDNYNPTGLATACILRVSASSPTTVTGLTAQPTGTLVEIRNLSTSSATITLSNANAGSSAGNQFLFVGDWKLPINTSVTVRYSGANWVIDHVGTYEFPQLISDGLATLAGAITWTGAISPTAISGANNDYTPTGGGSASTIRQDVSAAATVTGLAVGQVGGRIIVLQNIASTSGDTLTLTSGDAGSIAANRFLFANGGSRVLQPGGSCSLLYDGTSSRWRPIDTCGGSSEVIIAGSQSDTSTGTQDNFAISASASRLVWTGASPVTYDGFTGGVDGRLLIVENSTGTSAIVLANEAAGSTAANRITGINGASQTVSGTGSNAILLYEGSTSRWRLLGYASTNINPSISFSNGITVGTIFVLTGTISPTAISGANNDYTPTSGSTATTVRQDVSAAATVTGLAVQQVSGRVVIIHNIATTAGDTLSFTNEDAGSTAANRLTLPGGVTLVLQTGQSVTLRYDGTSSRWRPISGMATQLQTQADTSTGTVNDFALTSGVGILRLNPASTVTLNGIAGGIDGRQLIVINVSAQQVQFASEAAGSTAANRILTNNNLTMNISAGATNANGSATLVYDGTSSRWRIVAWNSFANNIGISLTQNISFSGVARTRDLATGPTLTSCGTTPATTTGESHFTITIGATGTGCIATFGTAFTNTPTCVVSAETSLTYSYVRSNTAVTITAATGAGDLFDISCFDH